MVNDSHPEANHTDGIEVTTGPLGQGLANAVGLAWAESHLAALYNKPNFPLFDNYTYCFAGDGCMQEGVTSEASSLAGHWKLGKLIVIYDDNGITIDGKTELSFSEDVVKRYESYGWHTQTVHDGDNDLEGIEAAILAAKKVTDKPSLISLKTTIGFGAKTAGTQKAHSDAMGDDVIAALKTKLGLDPKKTFNVEQKVYDMYHAASKRGAESEDKWNKLFAEYKAANPTQAQEIEDRFARRLPKDWMSKLPKFTPADKADATRNTSGVVLNALADAIPWIVGGSADLTPSNKTELKHASVYSAANRAGRYIHFGVREHGMAAIGNGIFAYGGLIPYTATFLNFIEYAYGAVRLSAVSQVQQLYIMTHDSIGLGEDGPTHQPIEALTLTRATPNMLTFRPADGAETVGCYIAAMQHQHTPSVFALSRQNLPNNEGASAEKTLYGAYVLQDFNGGTASNLDLIYVATGSEVHLAVNAAKAQPELKIRVVSMPSDSLFDQQTAAYRASVLVPGVPTISIEALSVVGWQRYSHAHIGMTSFGASAPLESMLKKFGFTVPQVVERTKYQLDEFKKQSAAFGLKDRAGPLSCHFQIAGFIKKDVTH